MNSIENYVFICLLVLQTEQLIEGVTLPMRDRGHSYGIDTG